MGILTPYSANRINPTHHVYINKKNPEAGYPGLPLEYKKALDKKACCEGKKSGSAWVEVQQLFM